MTDCARHGLIAIALAALLAASSSPAAAGPDGQLLYLSRCAVCHGVNGRGDGPDAMLFVSSPRNLHEGFLGAYRDAGPGEPNPRRSRAAARARPGRDARPRRRRRVAGRLSAAFAGPSTGARPTRGTSSTTCAARPVTETTARPAGSCRPASGRRAPLRRRLPTRCERRRADHCRAPRPRRDAGAHARA